MKISASHCQLRMSDTERPIEHSVSEAGILIMLL